MDFVELEAFLAQRKIPFQKNFPLFSYTSFRLGGNADYFVTPQTIEALAAVQRFIQERAMPTFVLGGGSNLLVGDCGFRGVVVHPDLGEDIRVEYESAERLQVFVPASARAPLAAKKISAKGFQGLEFLTTIPGHFGGSIIQNAGCYGFELTGAVLSVDVVAGGDIRTLTNAACEFAYRTSLFKRDASLWIAGATIELERGNAHEIDARITDFKARRISSQPKNRRSAGSIFKNPAKTLSQKKAWQLIDEAGLRGVTRGGCEISREHCNFIVNNGAGRAADVLALAELIETKVYETTGIRLEREVVFVGEFGSLL